MSLVYFHNDTFFKDCSDWCPDSGKRLASLSSSLSVAGVPTPVGRYDVVNNRLAFPKLSGIEARLLIKKLSDDLTTTEWFWSLLLKPLSCLHTVDQSSLDLKPIDPLRHVSRRLLETTDDALSFPANSLHEILKKSIKDDLNQLSLELTVCHGDYHVGQILIDPVEITSSVVDLDDVGLGLVEMDLSNLVAHMTTSPGLALHRFKITDATNATVDQQLFDQQFLFWSDKLIKIHQASSTLPISSRRIALYGAAALMRRALKLNERGHSRQLIQSILQGADALYSISAVKKI